MATIGDLVFGVRGDTTGKYKGGYALAFFPERNRAARAAVGAAPLTRKCLETDKVRHTTNAHPQHALYQKKIENVNHNACNLLSTMGFNGKNLKVILKTEKVQPQTVVVECTEDETNALAEATSHGARFHITGGGTACDIKMFKALALRKREIRRVVLKKDRAAQTAAEENEKDALKVLAAEEAAQDDAELRKVLTVKNLRTLLVYFGLEKKEIAGMKVGEMVRDCYKKLKDDNTPKKK